MDIAAHLVDPGRPHDPERRASNYMYDAENLSDDVRSLASMLRLDQREFMFRSFGLLNLAWPLLLLAFSPRWRARLFDRGVVALLDA